MTTNDSLPRPFVRHVYEMVETAETWIGAFFTSVVTLGIAGLVGFMIYDQFAHPAWPLYAWIGVAVVWLVLDLPAVLWWWVMASRRERPAAVAAAMKQPRLPILLRPVGALWWLAHFAWGLGLVLLMHFPNALAPESGAELDTGGTRVLLLLMGAAYCLATNGYLAFAVGALTHSRAAVEHVWARRWFIDVALILATLVTLTFRGSAIGQ